MALTDDEFRQALASILRRSRLSKRGMSRAMGRDAGYVGALLDPTRPSRARPTPEDMLLASDVTGIPFVQFLEALWGIPESRVVRDLAARRSVTAIAAIAAGLSTAERAELADFAAFLVSQRDERSRGPRDRGET